VGIVRNRKCVAFVFEENRLLGNHVNPEVGTSGKSTEDCSWQAVSLLVLRSVLCTRVFNSSIPSMCFRGFDTATYVSLIQIKH